MLRDAQEQASHWEVKAEFLKAKERQQADAIEALEKLLSVAIDKQPNLLEDMGMLDNLLKQPSILNHARDRSCPGWPVRQSDRSKVLGGHQ